MGLHAYVALELFVLIPSKEIDGVPLFGYGQTDIRQAEG
jgi:hypothetical protein